MNRPGEIVVGVDQVRRLIAEQFPQWGGLPIVAQPLSGTDNALFRLGDDLVARLPRATWAAGQVVTDATWLPQLAPHLPVPVPLPIAVGQADAGYPWSWTVVPWLPGRNPDPEMDLVDVAVDLAGFVRAMIAIEPLNGPVKQGIERGVPLKWRDELTRRDAGRPDRRAGGDGGLGRGDGGRRMARSAGVAARRPAGRQSSG